MHQVYTFCKLNLLHSILLLSVLICGCQKPFGFKLQKLYTNDQFTGRELYRTPIAVVPLLTKSGTDTSGALGSKSQAERIKKVRPDLTIMPLGSFIKSYSAKNDSLQIKKFFADLYNGDMLIVQAADSMWKTVPAHFALVFRLKTGMNIKGFDNVNRKRMRVEGELWDRDSVEVVWRASVNGVSVGNELTDSEFILEAITELVKALPSSLPGYGKDDW